MGVEEREPGHLGVTMSLSVLGNTWTVNFGPFDTAEFQHLIIFLHVEIDTQNRRDSTNPGWPEAVLLQKAAGVCMLHDVSSQQCRTSYSWSWRRTAGTQQRTEGQLPDIYSCSCQYFGTVYCVLCNCLLLLSGQYWTVIPPILCYLA